MFCCLLLALATTPADARPRTSEPTISTEADAPPPSADLTEVVEAAELGNRGDRKGAIKLLDGVLARRPDHAEARLLRGLQHYLLGHSEEAIVDLSEALPGGRYEESLAETNFDEVTNATYVLDLGGTRATGAAMLVALHVRAKDLDEATEVLDYALDRHGETASLLAADAYLRHARGDDSAWARLTEAVRASRGEGFVQAIVAELSARDADAVPSDIYAWLESSGDWKTPYNRAVAELKAGRHAQCVATIAGGLGANPGHQKLLELGYRCAARSDRGRADTWLEGLGGPRRAPAGDVLAHADLCRTAGDDKRAEALIDGLPRRLDEGSARRASTFLIDLLLTRGDVGRALRVADGTAPDADARVAHALIQQGEVETALRLLERACPMLEGEPSHQSCMQLLQWARTN